MSLTLTLLISPWASRGDQDLIRDKITLNQNYEVYDWLKENARPADRRIIEEPFGGPLCEISHDVYGQQLTFITPFDCVNVRDRYSTERKDEETFDQNIIIALNYAAMFDAEARIYLYWH